MNMRFTSSEENKHAWDKTQKRKRKKSPVISLLPPGFACPRAHNCELFWKWLSTVASIICKFFFFYNYVSLTRMWPLITNSNRASWSSILLLYLQPPLPCSADAPGTHRRHSHTPHVPVHFPLLHKWEEAEGPKSISQTWLTLSTPPIGTDPWRTLMGPSIRSNLAQQPLVQTSKEYLAHFKSQSYYSNFLNRLL